MPRRRGGVGEGWMGNLGLTDANDYIIHRMTSSKVLLYTQGTINTFNIL